MFTKQSIRTACWLAGALGVLVYPAPQLQAQTIIAQITGAATWNKGSAYTVTWNITGTPAAIVTQYGVKVFAVSMAGSTTNYGLTPQASTFSAKQATITANLTYTANTTLQIVLEDTNGNKLTQPYTVTFKAPATTPAPALPPAAVPGNPAYATAACNYVLGMACTGSYAQLAPYLVQAGSGAPLFPTQAAMQAYVVNFVGTNPGAKTDIITRAAGSPAPCTGALTALTNAFTGNPNNPASNGLWNSYAQLVTMAAATVKSQCTVAPPPTPTWTAQQHSQALAAAVALLIGATNPSGQAVTLSASDTAIFANTTPAGIQGLMMSVIKNEPALRAQIADNMYFAAYHTPDTAAMQSAILAQYGITWSAANDLFPYLQANAAKYNAVSGAQYNTVLTAAFVKLTLQNLTAAQTAALSSAQVMASLGINAGNSTAVEGLVRSYIPTDSVLQGQIVNNVYQQVFGQGVVPGAANQTAIARLLGSGWTDAVNLLAYLNAHKSTYPAPPTSAQLTAALNIAFNGLALQPPTAAQAAKFAGTTDLSTLVSAVEAYIKTDPTLQGNIVDNAYKQVFGVAPSAAIHASALKVFGAWTDAPGLVSVFNGDKKDYAPAAAPPPVVTPPAPAERAELCFGAVGIGCNGANISTYAGQSDVIPFLQLGCDPAVNGIRNCWVVPGSIKHDNCCHLHNNGVMCGGPGPGTNECTEEWNEAEGDVMNGRGWQQTLPENSDLTAVASTRYPPGEKASTAKLCAPAGTNITAFQSPGFCCSGRFEPVGYTWPLTWGNSNEHAWNVCAAPGFSLQALPSTQTYSGTTPPGQSMINAVQSGVGK